MTGGVQAWLLSSEITFSGCRPCDLMGKAIRCVALTRAAYRTRGVREPEHVRKLFVRKPGDPRGDRLSSTAGPVGEGQRPNARHVRAWEVGRRNIIDEANEQRCTITPRAWPTTGGVCGEKASGRGEPCSDGRDRHTGAGSSVEWTEQGTRSSEAGQGCCTLTRINVSASDLRQEPSAVVPHAGICAGGAGQPAFLPRLET